MPVALPQVYYNSKGTYAVFLALSGLITLGGLWLGATAAPGDGWLGWLFALGFGAASFGFVQRLRDRAPRLVLTATGVTDRTLQVGEIAWADIAAARGYLLRGVPFIGLTVHNEPDYLARLAPALRQRREANRALGFEPLSLNLSGTDADAQAVLGTVQERMGGR